MLLVMSSFAQKITRGPDIGEIYFLGPTYTGKGLYYSTDFGETAVCVDSIKNLHIIEADNSKGCIYGLELTPNLYFSNDFGIEGSWIYKTSGMYPKLCSGELEGYIYNNIESHSEDYGSSFINHSVNGFFGSLNASEIDSQTGTGYAVTISSSIPDSVFLLITYDNFDNLSIINVIHKDTNIFKYLTRGNNEGELFTIRNRPNSSDPYEIHHSINFGCDFSLKNKLNFTDYFHFDVEGGQADGELYLLYSFVNQLWQNAHVYILHSTDYGKTFEVFHPFAKGNEPLLANFSVSEKEVHLTSPIEFSNFSIGDIEEYQWDFDNDGIIDSYDETPTYVYQDTGWYSVKLTIHKADSVNSFLKTNYIHIIDTTTLVNEKSTQCINLAPNPFKNFIYVSGLTGNETYTITIFNYSGKEVKRYISNQQEIIKINTSGLLQGVYLINILNRTINRNFKIIKK